MYLKVYQLFSFYLVGKDKYFAIFSIQSLPGFGIALLESILKTNFCCHEFYLDHWKVGHVKKGGIGRVQKHLSYLFFFRLIIIGKKEAMPDSNPKS